MAAPNATLRLSTGEGGRFGASQALWATVDAAQPAAANVFFEYEQSASTPAVINTIGFNDAAPGQAFTVPVEFQPGVAGAAVGRTMGLALANPGATGPTIT